MLNMILRCNPTNLNRANTHRQPWQELDRDTGVHGRRLFLPACHVRGPTRQRETSFPRTHRLLQLHPPALHTPAPMFTCPTQLPPHTSFFPFSPATTPTTLNDTPAPPPRWPHLSSISGVGPHARGALFSFFFARGPRCSRREGLGPRLSPYPQPRSTSLWGPPAPSLPPHPHSHVAALPPPTCGPRWHPRAHCQRLGVGAWARCFTSLSCGAADVGAHCKLFFFSFFLGVHARHNCVSQSSPMVGPISHNFCTLFSVFFLFLFCLFWPSEIDGLFN